MDHRPIFDSTVRQDLNSGEHGQSPSSPAAWPGTGSDAEQLSSAEMRFPGEDGGRSLAEMAQRDLVATLQLLAERAQYITGATGSAIALRDAGQMVCRASAGSSAPEVGAQLQVNSGLSGESVRTKQTLRCDDAATDPRVNRESCEALGIASVVVMPLVQGNEVIGVFELFSDKAHVFDARDIAALERMGAMVFAALEQALTGFTSDPGGQHPATPTWKAAGDLESSAELRPTSSADIGIAFHMRAPVANPVAYRPSVETRPLPKATDSEDVLDIAPISIPAVSSEESTFEGPVLADTHELANQALPGDLIPVEIEKQYPEVEAKSDEAARPARSAVVNLRKCEGCGFPVSEGRRLCLDCEKKGIRGMEATARTETPPYASSVETGTSPSSVDVPAEPEVPLFLGEDASDASWLSSHKYMIGAIAVALAGIVALLFAR